MTASAPVNRHLLNGAPNVSMDVTNRASAYGDGVFETVLVKSGKPVWLQEHLQRLADGLNVLDIEIDIRELQRDIDSISKPGPEHFAVLKILVFRRAGGRGYFPKTVAGDRLVTMMPAPPATAFWQDGVQLALCQTRLGEQGALAGVKHLNRLEQVLGAAEVQRRGFEEGLMYDNRGALIEGTRSNLFLILEGGRLLTPSLREAGVAGIMRQKIIQVAAELGLSVCERRLGTAELRAAQEVFVCNSLFGIWPVRGVECLGKPIGPTTRRLQEHFREWFFA